LEISTKTNKTNKTNKPIWQARQFLEYSQKKAIERVMFGYKESAILRLFLPNLLRVEVTKDKHHQDADNAGGRPKSKAAPNKIDWSPTPAWWTKYNYSDADR
jgi:hypothetical protein